MVKTITKIGNSNGIIFDAAIMEFAHLKSGDSMNLEVHEGGTITLTPVRKKLSPEEMTKAIKSVVHDYSKTLRRLA